MTSPPPDAPNPKAEKPAPRRFIEKTAQSLIRWSPLGGTTWLVGHAILKQDWLMALILFPVTVVCAVWANYTEGFVEKIGELARGRGTNDAEGLANWMRAMNEALKWQLAGFDQKYFECQGGQCSEQITEGFTPQGLLVADLEDVFVPLAISREFIHCDDGRMLPMQPGLGDMDIEQITTEGNIWQLLAETPQRQSLRQMAILAYGGYGKTTLLKHITYTYATGRQGRYKAPKLIPVLLYLRKWQKVIADEKPTLPDLITQHHFPSLPGGQDLEAPPHWAKLLLKKGKALVMFDGFDEVAPSLRPAVSQWITEQMQNYGKPVFILTSRPGGYDHYTAEKPKTKLRVLPFNSQQRQEFITKWYVAQESIIRVRQKRKQAQQSATEKSANLIRQIEQQPELADMAKNPLLLNMIAFYHRSRSGQELPPYRAALYKEICKVQLGDRPIFKDINLPLDAAESQQVLQTLALEMMHQNQERLPKAEMIQIVDPRLKAVGAAMVGENFVDMIAEISELLVEPEKNEYEFAHLSFQAFLAANEIMQRDAEDLLVEKWQEDWWKDTMLFYAGSVRNPSSFLRKLLDKGEEAVSLADACRKNTSKKVDRSIEIQLRGIDSQIGKLRYEKLEGFLKNGQWKEADYETFRVMLEVVEKEKDDFFTREELLNFPCEDLLKIDGLWLEYSKINGVSKFGFSLQKEIIKKCGYKLDGSDPPSEVWYDFLDEVGWRDDPTYTLGIDTKNGTLPFVSSVLVCVRRMGMKSDGWRGLLFFSRIETCEF